MSIEVIEQQLSNYNCKDRNEESNALKEITQEIALMSLSRADFFKVAEFHGGTALRILYKVQRYSEDLDFALLKPQQDFDLFKYLEHMEQDFQAYGYEVKIADRKDINKTMQKQFLKLDSLGKELSLIYPKSRSERKIKIKFELDTNPLQGATTELKYLTFPLAFSLMAKDLPSLFAGKCHALLCRAFDKGRDWYDFIWFISNRTQLNFELLFHALYQQGPWAGQSIPVTKTWLVKVMAQRINSISWDHMVQDVSPLLKPNEQESLRLWSKEFFLDMTQRILLRNH